MADLGRAGGMTRHLYDGDNLVAEYDASGVMLARHAFGPGSDEPIAAAAGGGTMNCTATRPPP